MSEEVTLPEVGSEWLYESTVGVARRIRVVAVRAIIDWQYTDETYSGSKPTYQASETIWHGSFKPAPFKPEVGKTYPLTFSSYSNYEFHVWEILGDIVFGRERDSEDSGDDAWYGQDYTLAHFERLVKGV